ncbi:MAG: FecR domain-containing protein [Candidatus Omnitrophica bacterium]|nr:FecR domain-containing protein [Candidatus Omnitrophota bacterium]
MKKSNLISAVAAIFYAVLCFSASHGLAEPQVSGVLDSRTAAVQTEEFATPGETLADSLIDHVAVVSHISGNVRILRSGSNEWTDALENDSVSEGDRIKTDSGASVDIVYDDSALNVVQIEENTLAEFRGIEPTHLYLADGSIFNTLDALPEGQTYEVATDTAVNAIRGTEFLRTFNAADQTDSTVVGRGSVESFSIALDGTRSTESVVINENKMLKLDPQILQSAPFGELKPERASKEHKQMIKDFSKGVETRLEQKHGGSQRLNEIRNNAKTLMSKPDFRETFQKRESETRHSGPGGGGARR